MDKSKVLAFIKRLSNETVKGNINWQRMSDYRNRVSTQPSKLDTMLFECEFRHIDFYKSYYATINPGDVFILYEDNESGREMGIKSIGYKIYLWNEHANDIANLTCPDSAIYQLLNAIESCIAKRETNAEKFIDAYLNQN